MWAAEACSKMRIEDTQTYKVLYAWRENFGLSLTAHMLCAVMQRPWQEIRDELTGTYDDGEHFRTISCPDIGDIAYYVDYPFYVRESRLGAVDLHPAFLDYSDRKIKEYPPEEGYVSSWFGRPSKEYRFRDRAYRNKHKSDTPVYTNETIIATLRGAIRAS